MSTTEDGFTLDPRLAADTVVLTDLPLCRLCLMNDSRFPWLILVPRRQGATEIDQLEP
ncbi:MAG TPA: diadenosine tetraphosphate hydrolase, partial [Rhodanobacteraceae bacterium]|nr:diadenosine tetraphosphate hydrolase [Rhodanobacteraceae bacterium]